MYKVCTNHTLRIVPMKYLRPWQKVCHETALIADGTEFNGEGSRGPAT